MNTLFSKRPTYLSKHGLRAILALALLAATLAFGAFSFTPSAHAASTPASLKSAAACPSTIQSGSTGSSVKTLQRELNADYNSIFIDYPDAFNYPLAVDGQFGPQTRDAVIDFQYWTGIGVDGIVGPQTWHTLGNC
jgi:peptidoglycan hydrolase-like protein with peptidoglycan-binding domain